MKVAGEERQSTAVTWSEKSAVLGYTCNRSGVNPIDTCYLDKICCFVIWFDSGIQKIQAPLCAYSGSCCPE